MPLISHTCLPFIATLRPIQPIALWQVSNHDLVFSGEPTIRVYV